MEHCIFCTIGSNLSAPQILFQNEHAFGVKDISPKAAIHYLIIPKFHIKNVAELHMDHAHIAGDMLMLAQHIAHQIPKKPDFRLVVNNGKTAGQTIFHLHMHFLAGFSQYYSDLHL